MYRRDASRGFELIDAWKQGVSWFAHPDERGLRASHAFRFENGVWIVDPLEAPGIDEHVTALGDVVGVVVCSSWHARDADVFAARYDVPVFVGEKITRVEDRLDGPITRYPGDLPGAGVTAFHRRPFPGAEETLLYHEPTSTVYVPDSLGTAPWHLIGNERVGGQTILRLFPPTEILGIRPERLCCGHGPGLATDAAPELEPAIVGGRRSFPRAVVRNGIATLRAGVSALRS